MTNKNYYYDPDTDNYYLMDPEMVTNSKFMLESETARSNKKDELERMLVLRDIERNFPKTTNKSFVSYLSRCERLGGYNFTEFCVESLLLQQKDLSLKGDLAVPKALPLSESSTEFEIVLSAFPRSILAHCSLNWNSKHSNSQKNRELRKRNKDRVKFNVNIRLSDVYIHINHGAKADLVWLVPGKLLAVVSSCVNLIHCAELSVNVDKIGLPTAASPVIQPFFESNEDHRRNLLLYGHKGFCTLDDSARVRFVKCKEYIHMTAARYNHQTDSVLVAACLVYNPDSANHQIPKIELFNDANSSKRNQSLIKYQLSNESEANNRFLRYINSLQYFTLNSGDRQKYLLAGSLSGAHKIWDDRMPSRPILEFGDWLPLCLEQTSFTNRCSIMKPNLEFLAHELTYAGKILVWNLRTGHLANVLNNTDSDMNLKWPSNLHFTEFWPEHNFKNFPSRGPSLISFHRNTISSFY